MEWYSKKLRAVISELSSDTKAGLSEREAVERLERYGRNELLEAKGRSIFKKIAEQLSDFMILLLLAAALISFVISLLEGEINITDTALILAIVILNAVIGIVQETKAAHAIKALQNLSAPKTTVVRDGKLKIIDSKYVVPGDIAVFETGDSITADVRIIEDTGLQAEESSLTGESVPVDKAAEAVISPGAPLGDRSNMLYSGSSVVAGRCRGIVVATGMETEVGRIAGLIADSEPPETPLQERLGNTGKALGIAAIAICAVIFVLSLLQRTGLLESFMLSVSLAVAAVPEGLPAIVTIVLAVGVQRLARKKAIVRKLPAVETLGSATVICSDKTGTLTQNKMTVTRVVSLVPSGEADKRILQYASLCTNTKGEGAELIGNPTENAIVDAAARHGLLKNATEKRYPRINELPFDSARKLMTTVHKTPEGDYLIITKGAPDVLLPLCSSVDCGEAVTITSAHKSSVLEQNSLMAGDALRVLAVAFRRSAAMPQGKGIEQNLTFLGLIGMMDPPRPEVKKAVATCKRAGIKPVMITGDHVATASAIARDLGILGGKSKVITGAELDSMSDNELRRGIFAYSVFARVSPEHKSRIVKAYQANGEIVAMTGDGVNDAPALRCSDIGCAMGLSGTDVARGASDMILADDNFGTIVEAIREGRGIYQNIRKTIHFLLSSNIGEILIILVSFLMGRASPLIPIQLLWINLVTDSLPALALGAEPVSPGIMESPPIKPRSSMFAGNRGIDIIVQGFMIGALALVAYDLGWRSEGHLTGQTFAFAVLGLSQLVHAFNIRSDSSLFKVGLLSNLYMLGAFVICTFLQVAVICIPTLCGIFGAVALSLSEWRTVALLSFTPLVAVEISKLLSGKNRR